MTPTQEYIQKVIKEFREKFVNDHNKGEERFLRGLFIEEFESFLEQKLREAEKRGYRLGIKNALDTIGACYSPQSGNYSEEVTKDISKVRDFFSQQEEKECKHITKSDHGEDAILIEGICDNCGKSVNIFKEATE